MKRAALDLQQDELPFDSIKSSVIFAGRQTLYPIEVARVWRVTLQHVLDLCEEFEATGGKSGLGGVDMASGQATDAFSKGSKTARRCWRIPVSAYDAFCVRKHTAQPTQV